MPSVEFRQRPRQPRDQHTAHVTLLSFEAEPDWLQFWAKSVEEAIVWHTERDDPADPEYLTTSAQNICVEVDGRELIPLELSGTVERESGLIARLFRRDWSAALKSVSYSMMTARYSAVYSLDLGPT